MTMLTVQIYCNQFINGQILTNLVPALNIIITPVPALFSLKTLFKAIFIICILGQFFGPMDLFKHATFQTISKNNH